MRAVAQRVTRAEVRVDGAVVGRIGRGLCVLVGAGQGTVAGQESGSGLATYVTSFIDPSISWRDVEWLRGVTKLPVIIKGIVRADDARRAVEAGASGVVVSNHGGRQLDALPATIDVAPRFSSTGEFAAATTWSKRSRAVPAPCCSAAPCCGGWPPTARTVLRACSIFFSAKSTTPWPCAVARR